MIDFNKYGEFVKSTTSDESLDTYKFMERVLYLRKNHKVEVAQLATASIGMQAESGEFAEVVKKLIFQQKPWNEDERFHLKRELGDVLWYWVQGCLALGYTPEEVLEENVAKLSKRYPNGFEMIRSEVRDANDI